MLRVCRQMVYICIAELQKIRNEEDWQLQIWKTKRRE